MRVQVPPARFRGGGGSGGSRTSRPPAARPAHAPPPPPPRNRGARPRTHDIRAAAATLREFGAGRSKASERRERPKGAKPASRRPAAFPRIRGRGCGGERAARAPEGREARKPPPCSLSANSGRGVRRRASGAKRPKGARYAIRRSTPRPEFGGVAYRCGRLAETQEVKVRFLPPPSSRRQGEAPERLRPPSHRGTPASNARSWPNGWAPRCQRGSRGFDSRRPLLQALRMWWSLVTRFVRDEETAGSNPAILIPAHSSTAELSPDKGAMQVQFLRGGSALLQLDRPSTRFVNGRLWVRNPPGACARPRSPIGRGP